MMKRLAILMGMMVWAVGLATGTAAQEKAGLSSVEIKRICRDEVRSAFADRAEPVTLKFQRLNIVAQSSETADLGTMKFMAIVGRFSVFGHTAYDVVFDVVTGDNGASAFQLTRAYMWEVEDDRQEFRRKVAELKKRVERREGAERARYELALL